MNEPFVSEHLIDKDKVFKSLGVYRMLCIFSLVLGFLFLIFVLLKPHLVFVLVLLLCLVGSCSPLLAWWWRMKKDIQRVRVVEDGLAWLQRGIEHRLKWEDIQEVYRTEMYLLGGAGEKPSDWNRTDFLRLILRDGAPVRFDWVLTRYDRLVDAIFEETTLRLLPTAREKLQQEGGVTFGPVKVTEAGLESNGQLDRYDQIVQFRVGGNVVWHTRSGFERVFFLGKIPNRRVLLELVREASRGRDEEGSSELANPT